MTSSSKQIRQTKDTEHWKKKEQVEKEQVENADFFQSVVNKIMTTHKQCIKYNFVAPSMLPKYIKKVVHHIILRTLNDWGKLLL